MRRPAALILIASLLAIPFATPVFGGLYEDAKAAYERRDYPMAFLIFKKLADRKDASGENGLGVMYYNGQGISKKLFVQIHRDLTDTHKIHRQGIQFQIA